jgi:hypothetical protein
MTLFKKRLHVSAFIFLGHHQVVSILFQGKLYNAYSVVSVSLNRHDYKRYLLLSIKIILAYKKYVRDYIKYVIS